MGTLKVLAGVPLCLLLSGCFPMPHEEHVTPLVKGNAVSGGKPVAGIAFRAVPLPSDEPCEGNHSEGKTNVAGRFVLEPVRHTRLFLFMMAHRDYKWNLCMQREGKWGLVHTSSDYTLVDTGTRSLSEFTCDLSRAGKICEAKPKPYDDVPAILTLPDLTEGDREAAPQAERP